ncbi:hypothetical protein AVEN_110280-1 [Araneus ventricosus]|uniref:Uncharacterized protein n=1 Tax=Araneus ventricosus TaxID=182803 RepID=A0A4Y2DSB4_ARAVE|nr:hypothetical protein AVEN_110280-1 [Araneus ventricosus]
MNSHARLHIRSGLPRYDKSVYHYCLLLHAAAIVEASRNTPKEDALTAMNDAPRAARSVKQPMRENVRRTIFSSTNQPKSTRNCHSADVRRNKRAATHGTTQRNYAHARGPIRP